MEKLIVSPGFVKKIEDEQDAQDQAITSNSTAIAKLNSDENSTNDILASAVSATKTMFFNGSGSAYTGTVPNANYGYGTFLVTVRGTLRFVTAFSQTNEVAINEYTGSAWRGWQELAKKSDIVNTLNEFQVTGLNEATVTFTDKSGYYKMLTPDVMFITMNIRGAITAVTGDHYSTVSISGIQGLSNFHGWRSFGVIIEAANCFAETCLSTYVDPANNKLQFQSASSGGTTLNKWKTTNGFYLRANYILVK